MGIFQKEKVNKGKEYKKGNINIDDLKERFLDQWTIVDKIMDENDSGTE